MNISRYQVFLKVLERGGMTAAAEELHYTQSGISYLMKSLEKELGVRLLDRGSTGVSLTDCGQALLPYFRRIAEEERAMGEKALEFQGAGTGKIKIGTFCSVTAEWLPNIIKAFLEEYPGVSFDLVDGDFGQLEALLLHGQLDCAFLPKPQSAQLRFRPLIQDRYYAVLPEGHPGRDWGAYPLEALAEEFFILPREGLDYDLGRALREREITPNVRMRAMDGFGAMAMVKSGLGVTVLSSACLRGHDREHCVLKPLEELCQRTLGLATNLQNPPSAIAETFLSYAADWIQAHYGEAPIPGGCGSQPIPSA